MSSSSESTTESPIIDSTIVESATNSTSLNWASEWFGYIALCMFSMVLVVPTLGIFGLMIWEYFSDEAERKAERKKEIDEAVSIDEFLIDFIITLPVIIFFPDGTTLWWRYN